ncbi:MAG: FMN-binding negative transcriptional regulator [Flavobacteriales bacterium]|nr:FMN-binding negative transcriptional regulator [Flavobacteriales bacterium]
MYIPPEFEITDNEAIRTFLSLHSFGILSAVNPQGRILSAHLPFVISEENGIRRFYTHLANKNPLSLLSDGQEVQLIFTGTHGYVSSSWYGHPNVPTWNYMAVHVYGKVKKQTQEELFARLNELTFHHEKTVSGHINPHELPSSLIDSYMNMITGFNIEETSIQAAFKLSQNRNPQDFLRILNELETHNKALAQEMRRFYPGKEV